MQQRSIFDIDADPEAIASPGVDPSTEPISPMAVNAALERRILHGLVCEWDAALEFLDPMMARGMIKPVFRLTDARRRLGQWDRHRREITLSRHLVFNHGWDSVRDVLRHEMAHQLADTLGANTEESPHGPAFQTACHWLRADPKASGTYLPLSERIRSAATDAPDKILARVKKLLALASSANTHEAEAAMAKAHQLIDRHNIDLIQGRRPRAYVSAFLGVPALRQRREDYHLAAVLSEFYYVEAVWVPAFVLAKGKMGRVLEISGTPRNVILADYVHAFVHRHILASWEAMGNTKKGVRLRTDFAVGVITGFREKLSNAIPVAPKGAIPDRAIIRRDDPQLASYCRNRYPRIHTSRTGGTITDATVLAAGEQVGRSMVIHQGISKKDGYSGGLLPPA